MAESSIEWTDFTWNPLRARRSDTEKIGWHCERVSPGCTHCYSATFNHRNLPNGGTGLDYTRGAREEIATLVEPGVLRQPLSWRKPRRVFVCSMTDLFGEFYTDGQRDSVFAVMALAQHHVFQVLTKRPERMHEYLSDLTTRSQRWCEAATRLRLSDRIARAIVRATAKQFPGNEHIAVTRDIDDVLYGEVDSATDSGSSPLRNVWLGVTAEDQQRADERIPVLLDTPAAVRFVSYEPALGAVDFWRWLPVAPGLNMTPEWASSGRSLPNDRWINWIISGGESGPGARPCDVAWIRSVVEHCHDASVACFVKQLGGLVVEREEAWRERSTARLLSHSRSKRAPAGYVAWHMNNSKGNDPSEWPADLRVRQFPISTPTPTPT